MELEQTIKSDLHRALELLNDNSFENSEFNAELSHLEDYIALLKKNYNLVLTEALPGPSVVDGTLQPSEELIWRR